MGRDSVECVWLLAGSADEARYLAAGMLSGQSLMTHVAEPEEENPEGVALLRQLGAALRLAAKEMSQEDMDRLFLEPGMSGVMLDPGAAAALERLREEGKADDES